MTQTIPVPVPLPVPRQSPPAGSRIGVVGNVFHQTGNEQPTGYPANFDRRVTSEDLPYRRQYRLTAAAGWRPLDTGPHGVVARVIIENTEGRLLQRYPTPAERAEIDARVVEVGVTLDGVIVIPAVVARPAAKPGAENVEHFEPPGGDVALMIRVRAGEAKVMVTIIGG